MQMLLRMLSQMLMLIVFFCISHAVCARIFLNGSEKAMKNRTQRNKKSMCVESGSQVLQRCIEIDAHIACATCRRSKIRLIKTTG